MVRASVEREDLVYEAKWRRAGLQVKRRVGPAWLDPGPSGGWVPRRGRVPDGWYDEKRATVRMAQLVAEHDGAAAAADGRVSRASGASAASPCVNTC